MSNAGYVFAAPSTAGENIGYRSTKPGVPDPFTTSAQLHADLFIDAGIQGRGHRTNMMNGSHREIGAGIVSGEFNTFNAVMLTTDFAASGTGSFLTGVVYNDTTTADNFYTPNEGLGGVTITAAQIGREQTYTTTSYATSGGFSLKLPAGNYIVTASGPGFAAPLRYGKVSIGDVNVKRDFRPADAGTIRGHVFNDTNANGVMDTGESGIPNILMYIDGHRDGRRNRWELYARTNSTGAYKFTGLAPGVYRVRETLPSGQTIVSPAAGFHDVNLLAGRTASGRTFANASASQSAPLSFAPSHSAFTSSSAGSSDRVIDGLV
jgi:hypothetical protein